MMNVVISLTPTSMMIYSKVTFKLIQGTKCLICHISVNNGDMDIFLLLLNVCIDVL